MLKLTKMNRSVLAVAALGVAGFSGFGVFNTVNAYNDAGKSLPADNDYINTTDKSSLNPDGTFCNPYGCAGCGGCVSLQYQQNVEENLITNQDS
jgi:hypothetical protein